MIITPAEAKSMSELTLHSEYDKVNDIIKEAALLGLSYAVLSSLSFQRNKLFHLEDLLRDIGYYVKVQNDALYVSWAK